nr:MAG TPA: hypothetical protein [Bacteriophage sp.]
MTSEEIVQALRCSATKEEQKSCDMCQRSERGCFECINSYLYEAASLIEQMTAESVVLPDGQASAIESMRKEIEWKDMVIALAQRKQAKAEAERDALIEQIKARRSCLDCKHFDYCEFDNATVIECMNCATKNCPCYQCGNSSRWEWRGDAGHGARIRHADR